MTVPTISPKALRPNTVRAYQGATTVATEIFSVRDGDNNRDAKVEVLLAKGKASLGYHNNYERLETWWTEMTVIGRNRRTFGRRFTGPKAESKARADYAEAVGQWREATA